MSPAHWVSDSYENDNGAHDVAARGFSEKDGKRTREAKQTTISCVIMYYCMSSVEICSIGCEQRLKEADKCKRRFHYRLLTEVQPFMQLQICEAGDRAEGVVRHNRGVPRTHGDNSVKARLRRSPRLR